MPLRTPEIAPVGGHAVSMLLPSDPAGPTVRSRWQIFQESGADRKDEKFGRPQRVGVERLIGGLTSAHAKDEDRLARGGPLLDDFYQALLTRVRAVSPRPQYCNEEHRAGSETEPRPSADRRDPRGA